MRAHRLSASLLLVLVILSAACAQLIGDHDPGSGATPDAAGDHTVTPTLDATQADAAGDTVVLAPDDGTASGESLLDVFIRGDLANDAPTEDTVLGNGDEVAVDVPSESAFDATESGDAPGEAGMADAPDGGDELDGTDGSDGAGTSDASPPCSPGTAECDDTGQIQQICQPDGGWGIGMTCRAYCQGGYCASPNSCAGGDVSSCGQGRNEFCCQARLVEPIAPGQVFYRSYDTRDFPTPNAPATVTPFTMDVFEVTVGRFRNFVNAYDAGVRPAQGSGANPHNMSDLGWDAVDWNPMLPTDATALAATLRCTGSTWTDIPDGGETLPINCLDWYTAFAFCVWDGSRLPTEAEWNYAAAGGTDQRVYPWSHPPNSIDIPSNAAIYSPDNLPTRSGPTTVGTTETVGDGRWGHHDLAGNVAEWVVDSFVDPYPLPCMDCADTTHSAFRVTRGGDWLIDPSSDNLTASLRSPTVATPGDGTIGLRCVH